MIHLFHRVQFFLVNIHVINLIGKNLLNILDKLILDGINFLVKTLKKQTNLNGAGSLKLSFLFFF
jgi:hypothetical protein